MLTPFSLGLMRLVSCSSGSVYLCKFFVVIFVSLFFLSVLGVSVIDPMAVREHTTNYGQMKEYDFYSVIVYKLVIFMKILYKT
jgi:hypothetical protein